MTTSHTSLSRRKPQVQPDVVQVIDKTALVENILNQVIVNFCAPRKESWEFMWSVVLDTSVMSLGAKIKVALAAAHLMRAALDRDALHNVVSLRNAFAHHSTDAHEVTVVPANDGEPVISYKQLWVLGGNGKITRIKREEALKKFNDNFKQAKDSLIALNKVIQGRNAKNAA